ncbi:MAG: DUF3617 family protein [Pseudomonadota bacterium]
MRANVVVGLMGLTAMISVPSMAADLSPGLWEISMETRVAASPGFTPAPFQVKQCVTAEDARDPSKMMGSLANPGASSCTFTDKNYVGNTFRFTMQCAGTYALKTRGELTFTATTMNGTMTATGMVEGQKTEFTNQISARRLSGC